MIKTIKIVSIAAFALALIYALWLGNIVRKLPGISYEPQGVAIFNCDRPRDDNAISVCPKLYCEKYLRDEKIIDRNSIAHVTGESHSIYTDIFMIQGIIKTKSISNDGSLYYFCRMEGDRVIESGVMAGNEWFKKLKDGELEI